MTSGANPTFSQIINYGRCSRGVGVIVYANGT
jgi:hypothetical protein